MVKFRLGIVLAPLVAAGCQEWRRSEGVPVSRAWQRPTVARPSPAQPPASEGPQNPSDSPARAQPQTPDESPGVNPEAAAYVDGHPITRARLVDFLMRSHGAGVLEQMVVLDRAERAAAERGLQLTQADIDAEYDRWLRRLTNPELAALAPQDAPVDRAEGERLLERVLAARNLSRTEYMSGVRRNAYLRKIAAHDLRVSEAELQAEFRRAYGERATVRHIQLASAADADRVLSELSASPASFADLAKRHSANPDTAAAGGLMRDFSRDDPEVPALLRDAAFALEPGKPSNPVRIGEWFHIVMVESLHPPAEADFASVRPQLEARVRERECEPAMQKLHQELLDSAKVEVVDPVLAQEYAKKHRALAGASSK